MMLPPEFLERIERQSYIDARSLADALGGPSGASVRINRQKWPHPVSGYETVEWEPDGFYLRGRPLLRLIRCFTQESITRRSHQACLPVRCSVS